MVMHKNLQSDDVYHRVNRDFQYQCRYVQQTIELSAIKWFAINRISVTLRQSMRSGREPNGERVVIAGPAASRRIIWRANRWKKTEPAPLSFFEQQTSRGKIRGDGQSISIAIQSRSIDGRLNAILWDGSGDRSSFRTEKAHPVPCQLTVDNVPGPRTRTITRTHAFFDHHEIACKIFARRSDRLVDVSSSLELTFGTIFN